MFLFFLYPYYFSQKSVTPKLSMRIASVKVKQNMHTKMKATLESEDGKTWYVERIFYVNVSDNPYGKYQMMESKPYESMVLDRKDQK